MAQRVNKFGAVKTTVDGITFASKREAKYYTDLKLLERAGEIRQLELQPKFPIVVNGVKIGKYTADFSYRTKLGELHVVDVKSKITAKGEAFSLRKRLIEAIYPHIKIEVVL